MLQKQQKDSAPVGTKAEETADTGLNRIRIDLVKAQRHGLTLAQASALSIVHQLIKNQAAPSVDIDENRWWFIDGQSIHNVSPLVAAHPYSGTQHLLALHLAGLIEVDELENGPSARSVLRIKTAVLLYEGPL